MKNIAAVSSYTKFFIHVCIRVRVRLPACIYILIQIGNIVKGRNFEYVPYFPNSIGTVVLV